MKRTNEIPPWKAEEREKERESKEETLRAAMATIIVEVPQELSSSSSCSCSCCWGNKNRKDKSKMSDLAQLVAFTFHFHFTSKPPNLYLSQHTYFLYIAKEKSIFLDGTEFFKIDGWQLTAYYTLSIYAGLNLH